MSACYIVDKYKIEYIGIDEHLQLTPPTQYLSEHLSTGQWPPPKLLEMEGRVLRFLSNVWSNITIEPLVILYTLIETMSEISGEELYLQKACKVNFNHSSEICYNLQDHGDLEVDIQKFVVGVKVSL